MIYPTHEFYFPLLNRKWKQRSFFLHGCPWSWTLSDDLTFHSLKNTIEKRRIFSQICLIPNWRLETCRPSAVCPFCLRLQYSASTSCCQPPNPGPRPRPPRKHILLLTRLSLQPVREVQPTVNGLILGSAHSHMAAPPHLTSPPSIPAEAWLTWLRGDPVTPLK